MRRHEIDAVSLAAGLLFLVVSVVHIAARLTDTDLNLRWMVPAVLVLLGVLGLLGAIRSNPRPVEPVAEQRNTDEAAPVQEADEVSPEH